MHKLLQVVYFQALCPSRRWIFRWTSLSMAAGLLALGGLLQAGCASKPEQRPQAVAPAAAFTGPMHLRGSIGSMTRLRNDQPMLVSGYGLVVLPPGSGTGSSEVPPFLRERMINMMRKMGVGSRNIPNNPLGRVSPQEFLYSTDTALVEVYGFIPPGAVRGARFDLYVKAMEQTQTTSLAAGQLYQLDLAIDGANPHGLFSRPLATGEGPIYTNPFDHRELGEEQADYDYRHAVVAAGGRVTQSRTIQLALNQASFTQSRAIADRINERFPAEPREKLPTANALSAGLIELNVPRRFAHNPQELIDLIAHLFVQRGSGFEQMKSEQLAQILAQDPTQKQAVILAWKAMGRLAVPTLRELYREGDLNVRLAALEAGAWLQDERAGRYLQQLASHEDAMARLEVAQALVHLPRQPATARALRDLLNDADQAVRLAAYESLVKTGDNDVIQRYAVRDHNGVKFVIDRVPAEKPMIYITQESLPRLVIFGPEQAFEEEFTYGPDLPFHMPMTARLWSNRLMLRAHDPESGAMDVYYRAPNNLEGATYQARPTVATLAYLLGHRPSVDQPDQGLDLSYSEVVDAIYELTQQGHIQAEVKVEISPLARMIAQYREGTPAERRPERSETAPESAPQAEPASAGGLPTDAQSGIQATPLADWVSRPDARPATP